MASEIHQNDTTQFVVTIKNDDGSVNISSATSKQLIFQKPTTYDKLTVNANFVTNGSDGQITYTTGSGDLDVVGIWELQGYVQIGPSGWKSNIQSFKVHRNL
jgi:hypothetical protein